VKKALSYRSVHDLSECHALWNAIEFPLKICQTVAFVEVELFMHLFFQYLFNFFKVVHAILGLVRSNPMIVFIQIISRVFLVWGVANYIPHVNIIKRLFTK
jgi:hypothetical protein